MLEKPEDLVRAVAARVKKGQGAVVPDYWIPETDAIGTLEGMEAKVKTHQMIEACQRLNLVKRRKERSIWELALTSNGLQKYEILHEIDSLPWLERFVRQQSRFWGVTWGVLLQLTTLIIAIMALVVAILK